MTLRSTLDLPLHTGKAPNWLMKRMVRLSRAILEVMFSLYSSEEILRKFSDPFWFQALGCTLGFDWHSSGLTTTVCSAIKMSLKEMGKEAKIFVCGGKGATSRATPQEIEELAESGWLEVEPDRLKTVSRLVAKIDNSCLQDGFTLYHHCIFLDKSGNWAIIQQGMEEKKERGMARRYHWSSEKATNFFSQPHTAVVCPVRKKETLNLVDCGLEDLHSRMVFWVNQPPSVFLKILNKLKSSPSLPRRHQVLFRDIDPKKIQGILISTYEKRVNDFSDLLSQTKAGPKTLRALALVSELVFGSRLSFRDPARFSYAVGGKDGYPYPIDRRHYDEVIESLSRILRKSRGLGKSEISRTMKRLYRLSVGQGR